MSTDYGIGAGLIAAANMLQQISRGTGRTTHMLDQVQEGDAIVVPSGIVRRYVGHQLTERLRLSKQHVSSKFTIAICDPTLRSLHERFLHNPPARIHFEHTWVELFYRNEIESLMREFLSTPDKICRPPSPQAHERFVV